MDEDRYQQLIDKRGASGLSDEEADELGRLIAERDGQPYGGAEARGEEFETEDLAEDKARREQAPSAYDIENKERTEETGER
jgi:hypothetical protein